jgi:hypothetical protein
VYNKRAIAKAMLRKMWHLSGGPDKSHQKDITATPAAKNQTRDLKAVKLGIWVYIKSCRTNIILVCM